MITAEGTGFKTAPATLDHTRITIAAQALGIAQGALDYDAGYVQQREQFGQPFASFEGVHFMLADMAMKLEAARQLTYHAAILSERAMQGEKQPGLTFASSAAKCFTSDAAMEITTDAVQLLGGYGYVKDYPVERMMRDDAKITQIYEGTNQIQRTVMARQLLQRLIIATDLRFLEPVSRETGRLAGESGGPFSCPDCPIDADYFPSVPDPVLNGADTWGAALTFAASGAA